MHVLCSNFNTCDCVELQATKQQMCEGFALCSYRRILEAAPSVCRLPKRVVKHQDQRVLFIVAASRRSVHPRGLVGQRSQTLATGRPR
jgi:hypothetical protein